MTGSTKAYARIALYLLFFAAIFYYAIACTAYAFRHPHNTATEIFLRVSDAMRFR